MVLNLLGALLLLGGGVAPATAACPATTRMAALTRAWSTPTGSVMIAAHRGGHLEAPENSLAAIDEAIAAGADFLEADVQVSSDGVPFILHDSNVDRMTDGTGKAASKSYAELRRLHLKGSATPLPTLTELLRHACGRILIDLDMKTDNYGPVLAEVAGLGMLDQVEIFDADSDRLRAARAVEPRLQVMTRLRPGTDPAVVSEGLAPRIVHGDPETLQPAARDAIQAMPARIWANALGDIDDLVEAGSDRACAALRAMRAQGVSVFQTNQPRRLRETIGKCGLDR